MGERKGEVGLVGEGEGSEEGRSLDEGAYEGEGGGVGY